MAYFRGFWGRGKRCRCLFCSIYNGSKSQKIVVSKKKRRLSSLSYFTEYRCKGGFSIWLQNCKDVDECASHIEYCGSLHCTNTVGSFVCGCRDGFEMVKSDGRRVCLDINECARRNICPDKSDCINTDGSFTCQCDIGYEGKA